MDINFKTLTFKCALDGNVKIRWMSKNILQNMTELKWLDGNVTEMVQI